MKWNNRRYYYLIYYSLIFGTLPMNLSIGYISWGTVTFIYVYVEKSIIYAKEINMEIFEADDNVVIDDDERRIGRWDLYD